MSIKLQAGKSVHKTSCRLKPELNNIPAMPLRKQKILMNFASCRNRIHCQKIHGNSCICNVEFLLTFVKVRSITHPVT
jgi:hypothetical protein